MSKKQPPQNYTKISNALFDSYMSKMNGSEFKVTMAIARKTLGWQKTEDEISLSQFMEITGLSRQSVINGIESGVSRGTIERRQSGQKFTYSLLVQKLDQSKNLTSQENGPVLVQKLDQLDPKTSLKTRHTKEKNIKKGKKEESPPLNTQDTGGRSYAAQVQPIIAKVKSAGVEPRQFTVLVNHILDKHGLLTLVNQGLGEKEMFRAQTVACDLVVMDDSRFRTVEGIDSIYTFWSEKDWRAKDQPTPNTSQLVDTAGKMLREPAKKEQAAPQVPLHIAKLILGNDFEEGNHAH